jgi:hypothetical protein
VWIETGCRESWLRARIHASPAAAGPLVRFGVALPYQSLFQLH